MSAAVCLVLLGLLIAVTLCNAANTTHAANQVSSATPIHIQLTNNASSALRKDTSSQQPVNSEITSASPSPSTHNGTEWRPTEGRTSLGTQRSTSTQTGANNQTTNIFTLSTKQRSTSAQTSANNQTTNISTLRPTMPPLTSPTPESVTKNKTHPVNAHKGDQVNLTSSPGLVAILCIFCIVVTLMLVVAVVKCVRSPRSNFERLEDMPMGKVTEESPIAPHTK